VHQRLPTFEAATELFHDVFDEARQKAILRRCEEVVSASGLGDIIGVDIKHSHFHVQPDHAIVERQFDDHAVMKPEPLALAGAGTPCTFALVDGKWLPYEFVLDCPHAEEQLAEVLAKPSFAEELSRVLVEEGVDGLLGFHVLHREFLEDPDGHGIAETSGERPNELLLRANTEEVRVGQKGLSRNVMWIWGSRPRQYTCDDHGRSYCYYHCSGYTDDNR
jgi:hypothetical protein